MTGVVNNWVVNESELATPQLLQEPNRRSKSGGQHQHDGLSALHAARMHNQRLAPTSTVTAQTPTGGKQRLPRPRQRSEKPIPPEEGGTY